MEVMKNSDETQLYISPKHAYSNASHSGILATKITVNCPTNYMWHIQFSGSQVGVLGFYIL